MPLIFCKEDGLMSNIVTELKRGNQTLTNQVRNLTTECNMLRKQLAEKDRENYELQMKINNFEATKKNSELQLINFMGGAFSKISDIAFNAITRDGANLWN